MTAFGACLFDLGKHSSQTASGFQRRFLYLPPKSPFQSMVSKWLIGKVRELSCSAETQTQDSLADSCNHQTPQSPPWVCSLGTCESCCQDHHGLGRKPDLQARSGQHSSDMGKRDPGVVLELVYFISRVPCWEQNGGGVGGGFFFFFPLKGVTENLPFLMTCFSLRDLHRLRHWWKAVGHRFLRSPRETQQF